MKKLIAALLALCLILGLAACRASEPTESTEAPSAPTASVPEDTTPESSAPTESGLPTDPEVPSIPTVTEPPLEDVTGTIPTDILTDPPTDITTEIPVTVPTDIPTVSGPETTQATPSPTDPEDPVSTDGTRPSAAPPTAAVTEPDRTPMPTASAATEPAATPPDPADPPATRPSANTAPSATKAPAATGPAPTSPPVTAPAATEPTSAPRPTTSPATEPPATQPPTVPAPTDCSHRYSLTGTQDATCTRGTLRTYTCSGCGHSYTETVGEPIAHTYTDATCTQPKTCTLCGNVSGSALGHRFNSKAICTRCGEAEPGPIEIVIKVKDTKNSLLSGVTVSVYFDGSESPAGSGVTNADGEARIFLDHLATYQVKLSDLPAGVTANSSYTFSSKLANINLPVQPVLDPLDHSQADYKTGSTMADFTLSDTDGNTYRLYGLLEEKELVILDFWYCSCIPCKNEFPYFEAALARYGSDIALLALNPLDSLESILAVREELGVTFPMLRDTVKLYQGFAVTAYPVTVFIGGDGKILSIHRGAYSSQEEFFKDIDKYL